jgi:nucleoside-diphosphate-sugar epimerase
VVHLAWQIQPSHDRRALRRTNVIGTANVAEAAVRANVPTLVVASSVGAYSPGPKDDNDLVGEAWPTNGVPGSAYSRDKADVEALLDEVEPTHPQLRVVRLRPALTFQRSAAAEIARYFVGPLAPLPLLRLGWLPMVPYDDRMRVQAVHADDVAEAYTRAVLGDARGAYNIAADPVLDGARVAERFAGRPVRVRPQVLHAAAHLSWHARLQPAEPGWVRLAEQSPIMSTERAERELGWRPRVDALGALSELIDGMARGAGAPAPPLRPRGLADLRVPGHGNPY